ncbi:MAG: hypothetical protein ACOY3L_10995 [Pseudomonadota bacterium]
MLNVVLHLADIQDRNAARLTLDRRTRRLFPFLERIVADGRYQGSQLARRRRSIAFRLHRYSTSHL